MSPSKHINREHNLEVFDTKIHIEIPSYPWSQNSCWLDSSLEALYCVLNYWSWTEFEALFEFENQSFPSPLYYLYLCLQARRLRPITEFPPSTSKTNSLELNNLRDSFRQFLFTTKMVTNLGPIDTTQPAFASHWVLLTSPFYIYRLGRLLRVWICQSQSVIQHVRVERLHTLSAVYQAPSPHLYAEFEGSITKWFKSLTTVKTVAKGTSQPACYRKNPSEGEQYCKGTSATMEYLVSLPVVLTLEPNMYSLSGQWDFPRHIYPLTIHEGTKNGVVYDITARVFHSETANHFITRCVLPSASGHRLAVFTYDGMQNCGYSQFEKSASVDRFLAGFQPTGLPSGYTSYAVIYHLRGGTAAQERYSILQNPLVLSTLHVDLSITTPNNIPPYTNAIFRQMDAAETATWHSAHTQEYSRVEFNLDLDLELEDMGPNADNIDQAMEIDGNLSSSPGPSDPAHVLCRCGVESDGHREGVIQEILRKSGRKGNTIATTFTRLLSSPGRAALVQVKANDKFYYPGRILAQDEKRKTATVRMWRGIHNSLANTTHTLIPFSRIKPRPKPRPKKIKNLSAAVVLQVFLCPTCPLYSLKELLGFWYLLFYLSGDCDELI
ncbi:hypothetical protein BDP27DRAFT_1375972 [Rhodocollybia butyracea]|uniref:Uncharacterized protein n=1 Tax=Rhodocollybia butyracea TaxID=206335 RepID=A0A9P5P6P0_9AGAR|nr:hypothetical protein BDP27DRAFT_1375972 [Rhodocollybia butyracea]